MVWSVDMDEVMKSVVRNLRINQTKSEEIFWSLVRNRGVLGKKFLRQHPIKINYNGKCRYFITDFYCSEKKLAIEIDGSIHENQKDYDELRTVIINQLGINVLRFTNDEITDLQLVLDKLKNYLNTL